MKVTTFETQVYMTQVAVAWQLTLQHSYKYQQVPQHFLKPHPSELLYNYTETFEIKGLDFPGKEGPSIPHLLGNHAKSASASS